MEAWKIGETPVETYQDDQPQPGGSGGKTMDTGLFCSGEEGDKGLINCFNVSSKHGRTKIFPILADYITVENGQKSYFGRNW